MFALWDGFHQNLQTFWSHIGGRRSYEWQELLRGQEPQLDEVERHLSPAKKSSKKAQEHQPFETTHEKKKSKAEGSSKKRKEREEKSEEKEEGSSRKKDKKEKKKKKKIVEEEDQPSEAEKVDEESEKVPTLQHELFIRAVETVIRKESMREAAKEPEKEAFASAQAGSEKKFAEYEPKKVQSKDEPSKEV